MAVLMAKCERFRQAYSDYKVRTWSRGFTAVVRHAYTIDQTRTCIHLHRTYVLIPMQPQRAVRSSRPRCFDLAGKTHVRKDPPVVERNK